MANTPILLWLKAKLERIIKNLFVQFLLDLNLTPVFMIITAILFHHNNWVWKIGLVISGYMFYKDFVKDAIKWAHARSGGKR
jgi:hypothetical protein